MLRLKEDGLLPDQIRVIPDWQVTWAISAFHLATLCWLAWAAGSAMGGRG